jgi:hypothetical protein
MVALAVTDYFIVDGSNDGAFGSRFRDAASINAPVSAETAIN